MKRLASPLFVVASLLLTLHPAGAATRPRYGGTLRVELSASLTSLDPGHQPSQLDGPQQHIASLIFDRLLALDVNGSLQPQLAQSWQHDPDYRRWLVRLRPGVVVHSGVPLRPHLVAMSLAAANPGWRVRVQGDDVAIESNDPQPNLLWELACVRNSIVIHGDNGALLGTGPFRVKTWEPGRRLVLAANEDSWSGRPFLDAIEITMGRALRDQALDLQLGRTDVIEIAPDQVRRAQQEGQRVIVSLPAELVAIAFSDKPPVRDPGLREAIALSIQRSAIQTALLQKQGEAAAGLLPQWVSGYSFLFPVAGDPKRARQLAQGSGSSSRITLAYDWSDPVGAVIAERVAVNARDAGVLIQPYGENLSVRASNADARMIRIPLPSPDTTTALGLFAAIAAHEGDVHGSSPEDLYAADKAIRADFRLVPIVYVPQTWALSARVRNWVTPRQGGWRLEEVWLGGEKP